MNSTESKFNLKYYAKSVPAHDFVIPVFLTKKDGSKFTDGTGPTHREEFKIKAWAPKYPNIRFLPANDLSMLVELTAERLGFYIEPPHADMPWRDGEELTIKLSVDGVELEQEIKLTISEKIVKFAALDIDMSDKAPQNRFGFKVAEESRDRNWTKEDFYSYISFEKSESSLLYTEYLELAIMDYNPITGQGIGVVISHPHTPSGKASVTLASKHIYGDISKEIILK